MRTSIAAAGFAVLAWALFALYVALNVPAAHAQTAEGEAVPGSQSSQSSQGSPPVAPARPRLVRSQQDVFVIERGKRRWIVSPQVFTDYRFQEEWIEPISDEEMTRISRGPDLVAGPVLRAPDGEIWVVYQGTRRRIIGPDAYPPLYLSAEDAVPASEAQVRSYPIGHPIGNPRRPWMIAVIAAVLA
ncbi:MAG: hypothetical protein ACRDI2_17415, partial [Chloroflexota bacterium]